jgi:glycosyltransferase involved in cell wall biosynthesis
MDERMKHQAENAQRAGVLRMAFHRMGGGLWTAGPVYLRNLFVSLRETYGSRVHLTLIGPAAEDNSDGDTLGADAAITYRTPARWRPAWAFQRASEKLLRRNPSVEGLLRKQGLRAFLCPVVVHRYPGVATLSYIPDFQHHHLPEMFRENEIRSRDEMFRKSAEMATRILLPTGAARLDFEAFAPEHARKARVLHPLSIIPGDIYSDDPSVTLKNYNLPAKFFFLPNQWFRHKNHEAVFQALRILADRGVDARVVCCGNPVDYRHPQFFPEMWKRVSERGLRDRILYLGMIPRRDLLRLMRQSICVVNPSRFEGWGMTVDESRSLGKRLLLSDIAAHRFQDPPASLYFDPGEPEDLEEKMSLIWRETEAGPDVALETQARSKHPERIRGFAKTFRSVVLEAMEECCR